MSGRDLARARHRAAYTLVDQGLASLSNFALGIVVARAVTPTDYGAFALAYSVFGLSVGVARAVGTDPLLVRFSDLPAAGQRDEGRRAVGTAAVVGIAVGVIVALLGGGLAGSLGPVFLVMGIGLPVLLAQDAYRYVLFAGRRAHHAAIIDAVWVVAFGVALVLPSVRGATTATPILAAWIGAAALAATVGGVLSGVLPHLGGAPGWARSHADLGPRFAVEFLVASAGTHLVIYAVAIISGWAEAGVLRAGHVLMGPVWIAATGAAAAAIPEGVRIRAEDPRRLVRRVHVIAVVLAVVSLGWGLGAAQLPDDVGRALLGETWAGTRPLMVGLGVFGAGYVSSVAVVTGLRSLAAARRSFAVMVPTGALVVVGGSVGAVLAGDAGAVWGMVPAAWLGLVLAIWQLHLEVRSEPAG